MIYSLPVRTVSAVPRPARQALPLAMDDGGKESDGFHNESRDCTVRATAIAFSITYAAAHKALAQAGRKPGKAVNYLKFIDSKLATEFGQVVLLEQFYRCRFYTVAKQLDPNKRYIIRKSKHVFAVVGGKQRDIGMENAGAICKQVWEITPSPDRPGRCCRVEYKKGENSSCV